MSATDPILLRVLGALYAAVLIAGVWVAILLWRRSLTRKAPWERRVKRLRERAFSPLVIGLLIWIVATIFLAVGFAVSLLLDGEPPGPNAAIVISSVAMHWPVLLFCFVLLRVRGVSWMKGFGLSKRRWLGQLGAGGAAYLAMMPVVFVYIVLSALLLTSLGFEPETQEVANLLLSDAVWPLQAYKIGVAVLLAPIAEELLFRGMAFPLLLRYIRPVWAMLILSVIFAAIHLSLSAFLPLFVVSMALCLAYLVTGRIAVPIVMHVLFNALNLAWFWAVQ